MILDLRHPSASLRAAAGLSQAQAAALVERHATSISGPEQRERRGLLPSLSSLLERADAWGLVVEIHVRRAGEAAGEEGENKSSGDASQELDV